MFMKITANVPALGEVASFGTDYFLSKIKFLAKYKREFTTKFAILPNACYMMVAHTNLDTQTLLVSFSNIINADSRFRKSAFLNF